RAAATLRRPATGRGRRGSGHAVLYLAVCSLLRRHLLRLLAPAEPRSPGGPVRGRGRLPRLRGVAGGPGRPCRRHLPPPPPAALARAQRAPGGPPPRGRERPPGAVGVLPRPHRRRGGHRGPVPRPRPRPGVAPAPGELLLLRLLEPVAGPAHLRLDGARL